MNGRFYHWGTVVLEHERCRANTKQRRRETARCAAEGAETPPGPKTPFSPGFASAPSPVRALATALARKRTDGATRKPPARPSRHEKACALVSKLRWPACHASRRAAGFRNEPQRRCASRCDMAKSGLRVDARSLFVPRCVRPAALSCPRRARRSCPLARHAPKGCGRRSGGGRKPQASVPATFRRTQSAERRCRANVSWSAAQPPNKDARPTVPRCESLPFMLNLCATTLHGQNRESG